jgi:hypothetical protein
LKNSIIILAIIIIAVIIVGAFVALSMTNLAQTQNNLTVQGSKVTIINNNKDVWAHWDLVVENATLKNGSVQTFYIEAWMKPGENITIDLSNMLGYGNAALPTNMNIRILAWGGVYNNTTGGTSEFNTTFLGWTTNQTIPSPTATYNGAINSLNIDPIQPIGPLPSGITASTAFIGTTPEETGPEDSDTFEQLFTEIVILIDPNGVPFFLQTNPATLCNQIAQGHII